MKAKKSPTPKRDPKQEAYEMLDEPVANLRYGGRTMREALIKGTKRPEQEPKNPKSSSNGVQFEL